MSKLTVTGLYIYPVKSMKGIALERAQLTSKGLLYDRRWMVVRADGRFVTQRDLPRLSLVNTQIREDGVLISMQGHGSILVPFQLHDGEQLDTMVWKDACQAIDQGNVISRWLTQALDSKRTLQLVRMNPEYTRTLQKAEVFGQITTTDFADAAPFLVANEASLENLNSVLKSNSFSKVPMNRFRPNIVVRGLDPFAERQLASLTGNGYQLRPCYPCKRCIVTTIDQETAEKDTFKQPFKTLQTINPMPGAKKEPVFGEYATLARGHQQFIEKGHRLDARFRQVQK
jgi:uncharacterized protein YcbX